ncbi:MAG: transglycosylase SLT domain-containing protein [Bacteroidia bacterium]|nr:transglycosylase SLT domain-containing protein [Bacteroidia bacterium]
MKQFLAILISLCVLTSYAGESRKKGRKKKNEDVVQLNDPLSKEKKSYVYDKQLYNNGCDTLAQIIFWRKVMALSKDSGYLNIFNSRTIIEKYSCKQWNGATDEYKIAFRDSIKTTYGLTEDSKILFTEGKSFFYDFSKAYVNLHTGIEVFQENNVDPWYAQAILLIESPNKLQKSNVGAYGPFQLMKPVAKMYGLKVNRKVDERASLERSAYGASMLMKNICIPKTKQMLDTLGITYNEKDLWFRLLVLHSYHAGIGNVRAAIQATGRSEGGMDMIRTLWHTTAKGFKTASQSYSQVALAAMIEMDAKMQPLILAGKN